MQIISESQLRKAENREKLSCLTPAISTVYSQCDQESAINVYYEIMMMNVTG
jgi:hypothetical protein